MWKENNYIDVYVSGQMVKYYRELGYNCTGTGNLKILQDHLPKNSHVKVILICDNCGKEFEKQNSVYNRANNIYIHNDYCKECKGVASKEFLSKNGHTFTDYNHTNKVFEDRGYKLVSKEVKSKNTKLEYICNKHPEIVQKIKFVDIELGKGCRFCANERRVSIISYHSKK